MPVSGRRATVTSGTKRPRIKSATKVAGFDIVVAVKGSERISVAVKDYSNDPYFVKKAEAAKAVIDKVGLPKKK